MLAFIQANLANIIIGGILLLLLAGAVWYIARKTRRGECAGCAGCKSPKEDSSSCPGGCSSCHTCGHCPPGNP